MQSLFPIFYWIHIVAMLATLGVLLFAHFGLRGDLARLLLADLDVSRLPVLPFNDPQRNWFLRVTALDRAGKPMASADSAPFCRLAHDRPQPAIMKTGGVAFPVGHILHDYLEARVMPQITGPVG